MTPAEAKLNNNSIHAESTSESREIAATGVNNNTSRTNILVRLREYRTVVSSPSLPIRALTHSINKFNR